MCSLHSTGYMDSVIITCSFSQLARLHSLSFFFWLLKADACPLFPYFYQRCHSSSDKPKPKTVHREKEKRPYSFSFQGDQGINIGRPSSFPSLSCLLFFFKSVMIVQTSVWIRGIWTLYYSYENWTASQWSR